MITRILLFCVACCTAVAGTFNRQPAGLIKGARLSWVSGTTIKVGVGYGENTGEYWEIAPADTYNTTGLALTGLTATTNGIFHYIYIDKANSLFPSVTLINSTTAPAWSDTYMGWYNGQNRCIGAVWVEASGALRAFNCSDDNTYIMGCTTVATPALPTNYEVWGNIDVSGFVPVNASAVQCRTGLWSTGAAWMRCRAGISDGSMGNQADGVSAVEAFAWRRFGRDEAKKISWMAYAISTTGEGNFVSSGANLLVRVGCYRLER